VLHSQKVRGDTKIPCGLDQAPTPVDFAAQINGLNARQHVTKLVCDTDAPIGLALVDEKSMMYRRRTDDMKRIDHVSKAMRYGGIHQST